MKKIFLSLALSTFLIMGVSIYSSFAAATSCDKVSNLTSEGFKTSANVICEYQNDGSTSPQAYGAGTGHKSGSKVFETSNAMGGIYYKDITTSPITSSNVTVPTAGASAADSGYTEVGK